MDLGWVRLDGSFGQNVRENHETAAGHLFTADGLWFRDNLAQMLVLEC